MTRPFASDQLMQARQGQAHSQARTARLVRAVRAGRRAARAVRRAQRASERVSGESLHELR